MSPSVALSHSGSIGVLMQQTVLNTNKQLYNLPTELPLWRGDTLEHVALAYETWGTLSERRDNAILLLHALTGDSHAACLDTLGECPPGWWGPLIGPGAAFDTNRFFVICSNVIGGCNGSTGPSSSNPVTGRPYAMSFPQITIQDMVHAQRELTLSLGIEQLACVAGGSIGGMQAMEWAIRYPDSVRSAMIFGATGKIGPQAMGFNLAGRRAIMLDPEWKDGNYYPGPGPVRGLSIARMIGMLTYQSAEGMEERFGRNPASRPFEPSPIVERFDVESYLEYKGRSLSKRFDANSYLYLTRAMDLYDVAEGFASDLEAFDRIQAQTLHIGISSDWLFPPHEVRSEVRKLGSLGKQARYVEIESKNGHDSFLKDWEPVSRIISEFLNEYGDAPGEISATVRHNC